MSQEVIFINALLQLLVGVGIAVTSSYVTVRLARNRFRTERWWEKKVEAYERVIEAFHHLKKFASKHLDAEYVSKELPKEQSEELNKIYWAARDEIIRASDVGKFILSEEAIKILARYEAETGHSERPQTFLEYLETEWSIAHDYMKEFIAEAKRDLGHET